MSKRSIALAFALILGVTDLKAQDMGPFVLGRQYATMQQFDAAVVDWLRSKSSGKGEVALPIADSASRSLNVRAATVAKGLSVSPYAAGACQNAATECLRATDIVLSIYPVQVVNADRFTGTYTLTRRLGLQGHPPFSSTIIRADFMKNAQGIIIDGVITSTTPFGTTRSDGKSP
jgi:hypothetical protein